ncbi:unnamed protein product [Phytomonas sp. Hart1]|nr:unnamed protein product [Phytomonas sp. Hart1]|eukprot:CCW67121.1 unnamed protein product [Phytomonas sp. isolate Hart1]
MSSTDPRFPEQIAEAILQDIDPRLTISEEGSSTFHEFFSFLLRTFEEHGSHAAAGFHEASIQTSCSKLSD